MNDVAGDVEVLVVKDEAVVAVADEAKPAEVVAAVKDESKVFTYKGEIVEANSLRGAGAVACEVPEIEVEAIQNGGWGGQAKQKLPKLIIVVDVQDSSLGKKLCQV